METARDREIILLIEILTKRGEQDFNTSSFFIIVFNRGLKIKTRLFFQYDRYLSDIYAAVSIHAIRRPH